MQIFAKMHLLVMELNPSQGEAMRNEKENNRKGCIILHIILLYILD